MNILNKINIHPTTYIIIFLSTLTGQFRMLMFIMILIIIHEIGHIITSRIFNWKINKINILPFGGNINFDIKLNESSFKEAVVTIMGPIFQIFGTLILTNLSFISYKEVIEINNISYSLILFNLLPIVPLDGSKLLFLGINNITSYKKSHLFLIYTSVILSVIVIMTNYLNFTFQVIVFFLLYKTHEQYKNHNSIINKFILERYLYKKKYKKAKIIKGLDPKLMWKNRENLFVYNNKCITENKLLNNYFKREKIY